MKKDILATLQCNICGCTHIVNAKGISEYQLWVVKDTTESPPIIPARCENCDLDEMGHCVIKLEVARG